MAAIQKYSRPSIILSPEIETAPGEIRDLFQEMEAFEKELAVIEEGVRSVDDSCLVLTKEINEATDAIASLGLLGASRSKNSGQIGGAIGIAAAIAKTYGSYVVQKKSKEAQQKAAVAKSAIMQRKKDLANVKLIHVRETRDSLSRGCSEQIERLYKREFNKTVSLEDPMIHNRINLFIKVLSLAVKSRFLVDALNYYVIAMEAWQKGSNISAKKRPSLDKELTKEISGWEQLLSEGATFDEYLTAMVARGDGICPLPIAALLSNPCLLRNYVGINIGIADNCPEAIIQLKLTKDTVKNPLVLGNEYFTYCKSIIENEYVPPKRVRGFGLLEILILLVIPSLFFGLTILLFKVEHSTFWRIFFMLPVLCWTGLGIEYLKNNYYRFFPYVARVNSYNSEYERFQSGIKKAENKANFHILG